MTVNIDKDDSIYVVIYDESSRKLAHMNPSSNLIRIVIAHLLYYIIKYKHKADKARKESRMLAKPKADG